MKRRNPPHETQESATQNMTRPSEMTIQDSAPKRRNPPPETQESATRNAGIRHPKRRITKTEKQAASKGVKVGRSIVGKGGHLHGNPPGTVLVRPEELRGDQRAATGRYMMTVAPAPGRYPCGRRKIG